MSHENDDDDDEKPPEQDTPMFVELQDQEDPGFRAYVLHNTRLESLLHIWKSLVQTPLDDDDRLIMDEIRQSIKILLADQTHDRYLKAVSITLSAKLCGVEQ